MTPLLELRDVTVRYGAATAVDGVSLRVDPGERIALIGPNGAGKTSLLRAVSGLLPIADGSVLIEGEDATGATPAAIVERGVSHVPEGRLVFPTLSVETNLRLGAYGRISRGRVATGAVAYWKQRKTVAERLEALYGLLPQLRELRSRPAARTSGGQQQMVAIGRALMAAPKLLVIDELSLGLAPLVVTQLEEFLRQLNETDGVALLLVEQNTQLAFSLCDRAYLLETGTLRASGSTAELERSGVAGKVYLGEEQSAAGR